MTAAECSRRSGPVTALEQAFTWMTVLPARRHDAPSRRLAGRAMSLLPVVGLVCGGVGALVAWAVHALGGQSMLAAAIAVAAGIVVTRGMHVDGFADTVDALGSYAEPERARQIMVSGSVGPMGAAGLTMVLLVQVCATAQLVDQDRWWAVVAATTLSRCAPVWQMRRGLPAAPRSGFGEMVAESQGSATLTVLVLVSAAAGVVTGIARPGAGSAWWTLTLGALLGLGVLAGAELFARHATRRFGGIGGDVFGATIELALAGTLAAAALLG